MFVTMPASAERVQLHSAVPKNAEQWVTDNDYPPYAWRQQIRSIVSFVIVVTSAGNPESCRITASNYPTFDKLTCDLILSRSKFVPATDDTGKPIYSVYENSVVWTTGGALTPPPIDPDIVKLNKLPGGLRNYTDVKVALIFDQTGKITECLVNQVSSTNLLDQLACERSRALFPASVLTDKAGNPVHWLKSAVVRFSAPPQPK